MKSNLSLFGMLLVSLPSMTPAQSVPAVVPTLTRTDYDMRALALPSQLSETELTGRRLFVQYCALCHDPLGQPSRTSYGPLMSSALLNAVGLDKVRATIMKGSSRMPGFRYQFTATDVSNILAFIKTMSADTPTPGSTELAQAPPPSEMKPGAP